MYNIKNIMETLTEQKLEEIIDDLNCCSCDKCKTDIITYALNHLPPKYISTMCGKLFSESEIVRDQYGADIITELVRAANIVRENPQHDAVGLPDSEFEE